jgi:pSer/pThr/pTyr-binding forkhead associated (FHA) protein
MNRDLGSRNGLRVNGLVVEESQLHDGDEVAIGPIIFRVEVESPPAPPPPPAAKRPAKKGKPKPPSLPNLPLDSGEDDLIPIDL